MADIKATVTSQMTDIKTTITPQKKIQVTNYNVDAQNIRLGDLFDVDASNSTDGALLIYNRETSSFKVTPELDSNNTKINGGHY